MSLSYRLGSSSLFVRAHEDSMEPVSYTHLDVYKRQVSEKPVKSRGSADFVQFEIYCENSKSE